jgi:hypothetical protein
MLSTNITNITTEESDLLSRSNKKVKIGDNISLNMDANGWNS